MLLRREVPCRIVDRGLIAVCVLAASFLIGMIGTCVVSPRVMKIFSQSKQTIAFAIAQRYVHEAYPVWARAHPGQGCPPRLNDLDDQMSAKTTHDPWGSAYQMYCVDDAIIVRS